MTIFGREPAFWVGLVGAALTLALRRAPQFRD